MKTKLALTWLFAGAGVTVLLMLLSSVWPAARPFAVGVSLVWLGGLTVIGASAGVYAVWRDL